MKTVLVTAIGSFSADIAIKTCKKMGWRVIGCDIYPREWLADAGNVAAFYQVPLANAPQYLEEILQIIHTEKVDFVLPSTDVEVDALSGHREEIAKNGAVLCISGEKTIEICRNKYLQYRILRENNIDGLIPTVLLEECDADAISYPAVVKPYNGRSSIGLHYLSSAEALRHLKAEKPERMIVQPKIAGEIVAVDVVRAKSSGRTVTIARKELLRTANGAGTSVYVFYDKKLAELSARIAEIFDVNGCVCFEFIIDDSGQYHFIECNPRFSGGIEFSCMAGYDCVGNHFRCFTEREIDDFTLRNALYIARKYEEYITKTEDGCTAD